MRKYQQLGLMQRQKHVKKTSCHCLVFCCFISQKVFPIIQVFGFKYRAENINGVALWKSWPFTANKPLLAFRKRYKVRMDNA